MRFFATLIILSFVFVQSLPAQTQYFYKDYPELDSNYSFGFSLLSESSGYFLLYGSDDEVLGNNTQTYIASFDTSNALRWKHIYLSGTGGNVAIGGLMLTSDSCLLYCGATKPTPKKGILIKAQKDDGTEVFNRIYGDTAHYFFHAVTETSDSGYLIVGSTDSTNTSGLYDLYIIKVDQNGLKQWDTIVSVNNNAFATSSIIRINNVYYFTVLKKRNQKYNDNKIFGVKEDGTIVLNKDVVLATYGGYMGAIAMTADNQLLLGGRINEYYWPPDPSSGSINDLPFGRMYVGKYDTLGNNIWSKQYFCPNILHYTQKIIKDNDGYILGGGCGWGYYYKGTGMDFNEPSYSFQDNFLMKITENGDSVWTRIYRKLDGSLNWDNYWANEDIMYDMIRTYDGGIAAAGCFYPTTGVSTNYKQYAWILKTDSNGCGKLGVPYCLWREELPYNADSSIVHLTWLDDDATNIWHHVQGSKDGQWYFWELTPRMLTTNEFFDTVPKYHNYCYRVFGLDSTWARTCESAEICITTGIDEYAPESGLLSVYPNPASDVINCVLPENGDYEIVVYNGLGSIVHPSTEFIQRNAGLRMTIEDGVFQINISILPPGIYFIEARGGKILRGKFVKE